MVTVPDGAESCTSLLNGADGEPWWFCSGRLISDWRDGEPLMSTERVERVPLLS